MWTPRRLLVLFVAVAAFAGAFVAYLQTTVGRVDGLPQLPAEYLTPADAAAPIEPQPPSPTQQQLVRAFGANSPEVGDGLQYKFKFEERDKGLVFATGQPEFGREASPLVRVSPCSVGLFADAGKRVKHPAGEVEEISTFHADECLMQFDRPVTGPQDISKANLVGMELVSKPDLPTADPRRGRIWVTSNQRSADPNERLLFRTPGPLFYQSADAKPQAADAPQVWTAAPTDIIDCRNLPRPLPPGTDALPLLNGDALRGRGVVADMVNGLSLPPPTMTATGMKIYLRPKTDGPDKRNNTGYGGVRLIQLDEGVQINLWTDGGGGMPGSTAPPAAAKPNLALAAPLAGGLADGVAAARKLADKSLLVIETSGPFRYDFERGNARFDTAPGADPARPNNVTVTRIGATGKLDDLVCKQLLVDFFGGPDKDKQAGEGMAIKELTATSEHVFLSLAAEGFSAQGTYLNYKNTPAARTTVTVLRGAPVVAKKEQNKLEGGSADTPAEIVMTATDPPPPQPGQKPGEKSSLTEVRGPGRMSLFDAASNDTTLTATWKKSLVQQKDTVGTQVQDLLKFEGGGEFRDTKADFTLTADRLWLWLAPGDKAEKKADGSPNALPQRLLAVRDVVSRSPELEVGMAGQPPVDQLTVWFRDGPMPVGPAVAPLIPTPQPTPAAVAVNTSPATKPDAGTPPPALAAKPAEKKQPILLSARAVETWVLRYPLPADPAKKGTPPGLKYEMERARCDDRVVVHQEPADPATTPRGLDVTGQTLNLTQGRAGSVMVVTGTPLTKAEVHFETTTIIGPHVTIDQPNNAVAVDGPGLLRMPSTTDLGGGDRPADRPTELEVTWSKDMRFEGANAHSEFRGAVKAVQTPDRGNFRPKGAVVPRPVGFRPGLLPVATQTPATPADDPTWSRTAVFCHQMDVDFDRPVYFSQMRRQADDKDKKEAAKLRRAMCVPKPDDELGATPGPLDRTVVYLEETLDRKTRKLTRAQRIECKALEMINDDARREQQFRASGEGELRILQAGSSDSGFVAVQPSGGAKPAPGETMKLTWVKFATRMDGLDQAKLFQSATFPDGARVWQTPTDDLNLVFEPSSPPPGTVSVICDAKLEVSSQKLKPGDPADQRMTATGSAEAESDDYRGAAPTIRFQRETVVFDGDEARQAALERRQRGVGGKTIDYTRGKQVVYNTKTKMVTGDKITTGSFTPGGK